eukprot:gene18817-22057_t
MSTKVRSLLMQSIERGDVPKIHKILAENPSLLNDGLDEYGTTALIQAVRFNQVEVVRYLLANPGIDVNRTDNGRGFPHHPDDT